MCVLSSPRRWRLSAADGSMVRDGDRDGDGDGGRTVLRGSPVTPPAAARRPASCSGHPSQQAALSGSSYQGDSMSAQLHRAGGGGGGAEQGAQCITSSDGFVNTA